MAYDENLAGRLRALAAAEGCSEEKHMFGGICWLLGGNMAVGIIGDDAIVRVGAEGYAEAMAQPHTRVFDFTGRPMAGWVLVGPGGTAKAADLKRWVKRGATYARALPEKAAKKAPAKKAPAKKAPAKKAPAKKAPAKKAPAKKHGR